MGFGFTQLLVGKLHRHLLTYCCTKRKICDTYSNNSLQFWRWNRLQYIWRCWQAECWICPDYSVCSPNSRPIQLRGNESKFSNQ